MYVTFMQKVPVLFICESTHSKTGRRIATLFWRSRAGSRRGQVVSSLPVRGGEPEGGSQSVRQWKWRRRPAQCRKLSLFWIAFNFTEQPQKTRSKKSKTWRGRKTKKREREKKNARCSKLLFAAICRELSSGVDFFFPFFFFVLRGKREKVQSTKLNVRKVKLPACVFQPQAPGSPINPCSTVRWYVNMDYYCCQMLWWCRLLFIYIYIKENKTNVIVFDWVALVLSAPGERRSVEE